MLNKENMLFQFQLKLLSQVVLSKFTNSMGCGIKLKLLHVTQGPP